MRSSRALRRSRGRILAGATTALAVGAGLLVLGTPAAATGNGVVTLDAGGIEITAVHSYGLWLKATIMSADGTTPLATVDNMAYDWSIAGWSSAATIQLPAGTAYGSYPVNVDYRPTTGPTQHLTDVGMFQYAQHARVTNLAFDRASTDYDHPSATLTGSVQVFDPVTLSTAPAPAGTTVQVSWSVTGPGIERFSPVTDASGNFSLPVTPGGAMSSGMATVVPSTNVLADQPVGAPDLPAEASTVRITGGPTSVRVHAGSTYRMSGTVQRLTSGGWVPLANAVVDTTPQTPDWQIGTPPGVMGSGASNSSGSFSYLVTATTSGYVHTYAQATPYLADETGYAGYLETQLFVPTPGYFSSLVFSVDAFYTAKVTGGLHGSCYGERVALQYSANGSTSWTTIGAATVNPTSSPTACTFTVTGRARVDGYYRVVHAESNDMLAITSSAVRRNRIPTRFVSFATSPTYPYLNGPLTATGRLQQYTSGAWRPYASAQVALAFQPSGDPNWYWVVKAYTTSTGAFTLRGKDYGTGYWAVYVEPDTRHFYSQTAARYITAR